MYEVLKGKKLLIIGADVNDMEIVRTAQSMGIYAIVVDWTTGDSKSPAKKIANEAWDINYRDLDSLVDCCIREKVDGIIAGYSESRVLLAAQLCKRLGKPFYANEDIVNITRDKRQFKELCKKYGVPIPTEFCNEGKPSSEAFADVKYPVIVKPADSGGRFGITVCNKAECLEMAVDNALYYSENKTVIIEEFVAGVEMSSIYNMSDGKIELAFVNDKYQIIHKDKLSTLCHATITPSKNIKEYMENIDPYIRRLLRGIGAKNGVAFFQMIAGVNGIRVFEMGYRLNGGNDQHIIEKYNNINHMKMLISYSLIGNMGDDINKNNPDFNEIVVVDLTYVHGGTVGKVKYTAKEGQDGVIAVTQKVFPGTIIVDNGTTQQEALVIKLCAKTLDEMISNIHKVRAGIIIENEFGENMQFDSFDTSRLFS